MGTPLLFLRKWEQHILPSINLWTTYLFIYNKANWNSNERKSLKKTHTQKRKFTKTELIFNKHFFLLIAYKIFHIKSVRPPPEQCVQFATLCGNGGGGRATYTDTYTEEAPTGMKRLRKAPQETDRVVASRDGAQERGQECEGLFALQAILCPLSAECHK